MHIYAFCTCVYLQIFIRVSEFYVHFNWLCYFYWMLFILEDFHKVFISLAKCCGVEFISWSVSTSELPAFVSHTLVLSLTHRHSLPQSFHHPAVWTAQHRAVFLRCCVLISILSDKNYMLSTKLSKMFSNSTPLPAASF